MCTTKDIKRRYAKDIKIKILINNKQRSALLAETREITKN